VGAVPSTPLFFTSQCFSTPDSSVPPSPGLIPNFAPLRFSFSVLRWTFFPTCFGSRFEGNLPCSCFLSPRGCLCSFHWAPTRGGTFSLRFPTVVSTPTCSNFVKFLSSSRGFTSAGRHRASSFSLWSFQAPPSSKGRRCLVAQLCSPFSLWANASNALGRGDLFATTVAVSLCVAPTNGLKPSFFRPWLRPFWPSLSPSRRFSFGYFFGGPAARKPTLFFSLEFSAPEKGYHFMFFSSFHPFPLKVPLLSAYPLLFFLFPPFAHTRPFLSPLAFTPILSTD